jgi:hypothetical protein
MEDKKKPACTNGPSCQFLKQQRCNFFHSQRDAQQQGGRTNQLKQCKFGPNCDKGRNCGFLHLPTDFLPQKGGRRN